ncbi:M48 family metallopeptidase [Longimicrobium sp.]|uniref:M48 family metallopeptidase n=1 Tax=Longimicrobium sp. TaxID=2029185 RepID=UPI002E380CBC|nr:M48 family metallopeptidase [Longimicrobium sp.]HEX6038155.1 M48 family metallopeptidase [Longimicrobium sp.]
MAGAASTAACAGAVSTQQEVALGADYSRQINQQLPLLNDGPTLNYVNQIGQQIAAIADPRGIRYNFYVVNSDVVNAFALPGGYVYVNRGLIERADNLSEFTGVLSHEIGHVAQRHSIEQLQRAQNANLGLQVLYGVLLGRNPSGVEQAGIQLGGGAVFAGYTRDAEREADAVAVGYMVRAGYNPRGMVTFFQELLSMQQRQPSRVEQWFATHPTTQERVTNAQAAIARTPGATGSNLTTDTRAFQNFRSRVASLPAPADRGR